MMIFCLLNFVEYLHFALPTGLSVPPEFKHEVVSRVNLSLSVLSGHVHTSATNRPLRTRV